MAQPGPLPTISKPRRGRKKACDPCKKDKKACDGDAPCKRCTSGYRVCAYSSSSQPVSYSPSPSGSLTSSSSTVPEHVVHILDMSEEFARASINRNYLELYYWEVNPVPAIYHPIDLNRFTNPDTLSVVLQYYCAMASITRNLDPANTVNSLHYEQKARQVAGKLMEEFTMENMEAFQLLAWHFWGSDSQRCEHYREISLSIGRQVVKILNNSADLDKLLLIQLTTLSINDIDNSSLHTDLQQMGLAMAKPLADAMARAEVPGTGQIVSKTMRYMQFRAGLSHCLQAGEQSEWAALREQSGIAREYIHMFKSKQVVGPTGLLMASLVDYLAGKRNSALAIMQRVAGMFAEDPCLVDLTGPYYLGLGHLAFQVAFQEQEMNLAHQLAGIQLQLTARLPSARAYYEKETAMIQNLQRLACWEPASRAWRPVVELYRPPQYVPNIRIEPWRSSGGGGQWGSANVVLPVMQREQQLNSKPPLVHQPQAVRPVPDEEFPQSLSDFLDHFLPDTQG